ncbi:MAG TPA: DUF6622 family protein [Burkholderiaceae bacterium]|nr:DUF6622 family protein [Burkholderiaceae bacterium]
MIMLTQALLHTPRWVFGLFLALLALGLQQLFPRSVTLLRASLLPVAMIAFSANGVASMFASQPLALLAWLAALALSAILIGTRPATGVSYDFVARRFSMPGSAAPLAMMMSLFLVRYAMSVALVVAPQPMHSPALAVGAGLVLGAFSGAFLGRAARLWKLALAATQSRQVSAT